MGKKKRARESERASARSRAIDTSFEPRRLPSPTLLRNRPRLRAECRKAVFQPAEQRGQWLLKAKPGVLATMSRSYNDELQFLDKINKNCWRIKKGFVPNMQVRRGCRARGWGPQRLPAHRAGPPPTPPDP